MSNYDKYLQTYKECMDCMTRVRRDYKSNNIALLTEHNYFLHSYMCTVGNMKNYLGAEYEYAEVERKRTAAVIIEEMIQGGNSATKAESLVAKDERYITARQSEILAGKMFNQFRTLWEDVRVLIDLNRQLIGSLKQEKSIEQFQSESQAKDM